MPRLATGRFFAKDATLGPTLSVVLPVRNAESSLRSQVDKLLEILPDLTHRFELVIVDDGSTDHTPDIVQDIQAEFPQVRYTRHAQNPNSQKPADTGISQCRGDVVIVQDESTEVRPSDIKRLWEMRIDSLPLPPTTVMERADRKMAAKR
jgi:glycosyltransferase involved in cell wall biosynthesis